jgi:hypothetical protein
VSVVSGSVLDKWIGEIWWRYDCKKNTIKK